MTKDLRALLLPCFALSLLVASAACGSPEPAPPPAVDDEAIRATVIALESAMNLAVDSLDCDSGTATMGDQEPIFAGGGRTVRNRADLKEMCVRMNEPRTGAEFAPDVLITAHVLSSDVAYVVREGDYTINFKDGSSNTVHLVMTTIWNRQADGWKMVHLHESVPAGQ